MSKKEKKALLEKEEAEKEKLKAEHLAYIDQLNRLDAFIEAKEKEIEEAKYVYYKAIHDRKELIKAYNKD